MLFTLPMQTLQNKALEKKGEGDSQVLQQLGDDTLW